VNVLVLAAGQARRMGLPKLLLPAGPGHTLLSRTIQAALGVSSTVTVVLGPVGPTSQLPPGEGVRFVHNTQPALSSSVRLGLKSLHSPADKATDKVLVMLADQPLVPVAYLKELMALSSDWAVCAAEQGQPKPPLVLGPALLQYVEGLQGDQGFRSLLRQHRQKLCLLEAPQGCLVDIDTWEIYRQVAYKEGWDQETANPAGDSFRQRMLQRLAAQRV
jgi:molybdenum cofactor cytidylyltransferase